MTIGLAEAAKGTKTRVHLPTGKDVEVKIPAGLTDGQIHPPERAGLADRRTAKPATR